MKSEPTPTVRVIERCAGCGVTVSGRSEAVVLASLVAHADYHGRVQ